jgi:hypothetical protein
MITTEERTTIIVKLIRQIPPSPFPSSSWAAHCGRTTVDSEVTPRSLSLNSSHS